jgi:hypothetical protein
MPRRRSKRLQRYIDLGFIIEAWAVTEAERDENELAKTEAEEDGLLVPPGICTWRGVASLSVRERGEGGRQTIITKPDGTQMTIAGELVEAPPLTTVSRRPAR